MFGVSVFRALGALNLEEASHSTCAAPALPQLDMERAREPQNAVVV